MSSRGLRHSDATAVNQGTRRKLQQMLKKSCEKSSRNIYGGYGVYM